tara:strand:- start:418 stop:600 length:183 start_codon:yes stop_codon:yes gene_type:complete
MNKMSQCLYDELKKEDGDSRKEFNNDELWKLWINTIRGVFHHIKERQFRGGNKTINESFL